jgi:enoyl-CoA hydratase/carnithine racemase
MTYSDIEYSARDGVALITLNRPERLNAWREQMHREVRSAMRAAADDAAVRVIILTGAGRGFCAGADMTTLQGLGADTAPRRSGEPFDASARPDFMHEYSWMPAVPKPIIAAINGACAGLGLVLSLYADIRFASARAKFTTAFARRGLIAEHGISWLLPRTVGFSNAADLLYSARMVDAVEALRIGLVSRVFSDDSFERDTWDYAQMLASEVSPRSLREMKREIWAARFQSLGEAIESANADMKESFASDDFREGVAHFVEKRPPRFTGG